MGQRALVRGGLATAVTLALAVPLFGGAPAQAETAPAPYDVTVPAVNAPYLSFEGVAATGATGYLFTASAGEQWVPYDGSTPWTITQLSGTVDPLVLPDGGERLAYQLYSSAERLADPRTGAVTDFTMPAGYTARTVVGTATGWSVLATSLHREGSVTGTDYHLLDAVGSALVERQMTGLPQNVSPSPSQTATAEASGRFVITQTVDGLKQLTVVDPGTGTVTALPAPVPAGAQILTGSRYVGWLAGGAATLYGLADPAAAPRTIALPPELPVYPTGYSVTLTDTALLAVRKGAVWNDTTTSPLFSVPLDGGTISSVLPDSAQPVPNRVGGAYVSGGASADTWDTYLFAPDGSSFTDLYRRQVVRPVRFGLSLARGELNFMEGIMPGGGTTFTAQAYLQNEGTGAVPQPAARPNPLSSYGSWPAYSCDTGQHCTTSLVNGSDERGYSYVSTGDNGKDIVDTLDMALVGGVPVDSTGGRIVDASEHFTLYNSGSNGKQYVVSPGYRKVVLTRPIAPAALWGDTLYTATATKGQLAKTDLHSRSSEGPVALPSLTTDAPCAVKEVQALGRWLYWSCGTNGPAGVYDTTAKKSVAVPAGPALLGDGFVLRHSGDTLQVTDVVTGATHKAAVLPADPALPDAGRGNTWTVDKFRGQIAYTARDATTHLIPSGIASSPLNVVWSPGISTELDARGGGWGGEWLLSGAAASWKIEFRASTGGPVVRTVTGGAVRSSLVPEWDGKDSAGRYVTNGFYTWTLTVLPANGSGPALTRTGRIGVRDAAAVFRDYGHPNAYPDGAGDLFTLDSAGRLSTHYGTGTGTFSSVKSYGGWNTKTLFVPMGDVDANGCNDMLVRLPSGEARIYRSGAVPCTSFAPSSTYKKIGTGWQLYNAVTSPGDITGDGRPDILARTAATGQVWLYASNGSGFKTRTVLYANASGYKKLIGAGDLNGDGIGDLLGWDSTGLWRYYGTGKGTFGARVLISRNWGAGYNAVVGVGDITGDGKADLVERDSAGTLWRNSGDGKGAFGPRVKIATGYNAYLGLA